jgi:hypothetical protein
VTSIGFFAPMWEFQSFFITELNFVKSISVAQVGSCRPFLISVVTSRSKSHIVHPESSRHA